jgi:hypothetical protein
MNLSNDVLPTTVLRHGAYMCFQPTDRGSGLAQAPIDALAARMGFANEFHTSGGHPEEAVAFVRQIDVTPGHIADDALCHAALVVHVASPAAQRIDRVCEQALQLTKAAANVRVLRGVVRPTSFTGGAMQNFAYQSQRQQESGGAMPNAFIVPTSRTPQWWTKNWMERHTYFLPRYDDLGRMLSEGHALVAAFAIPHLMRRTYKHITVPAPAGEYDFLNYFECADDRVPMFHEVCAALRDVARNPEWQFMREGPTWRGRRVASWSDLFR